MDTAAARAGRELSVVRGFADEGFGRVADVFAANLRTSAETGAACAIYHHGRLVVDLYGGLANAGTRAPWTSDTLTVGFSVGKGLMALCAYIAHQRGLLDFDAPVTDVWPEFGANGKGDTVIRDLFSHRCGLISLDANLTMADIVEWTPVIRAIEAQRPSWKPGTAYAYHAQTYGWLTGEVLRRVTGLMPGALLAEYLTGPLNAEAWFGLPADLEFRVAKMYPSKSPVMAIAWRASPIVFPRIGLGPMVRVATMGQAFPFRMVDGGPNDYNSRAVHAAQIPASNVILNARSLAKIYAATVSEIDRPRLLTEESLLDAVVPRSERGSSLRTLTPPGSRFSTGFLINRIPYRPLISDSSFGHDAVSGSLGFADADHEIGFGYLNNQMSGLRDTRANRLTAALRDCLGV